MIHLVYGGSGSGKSAYAESLVQKINSQKKYYLATMKVYGKEGILRVQRHKQLRAGKGFITLEHETFDNLNAIISSIEKKDSTVLIECISNLVANEMFKENKIFSIKKVTEKIFTDFNKIKNCAENFIIVTNNIFEDGMTYDENTENYMKALAEVNIFLAELADKITEVVCGIPVEIKK